MAITVPTEGYCQAAQVTGITGKEYRDAATGVPVTKPSYAQCETFIKQVADQINGVLAAVGISIPVALSATRSQRILEHLNALGAAVRTENAVPGIMDTIGRAAVWQEQYHAELSMLARKQMVLPDAATSSTEPQAPYNQAPDSDFDDAFFSRSDQV